MVRVKKTNNKEGAAAKRKKGNRQKAKALNVAAVRQIQVVARCYSMLPGITCPLDKSDQV